jgi:hypothetical protein
MLAIESGTNGVVKITGRLDASEAPRAQSFFDQVQEPSRSIARTSSTFRAPAWRAAQDPEAAPRIGRQAPSHGVNSHLSDILGYSGFDQIFEIERAR